jgi:hypothetical protein
MKYENEKKDFVDEKSILESQFTVFSMNLLAIKSMVDTLYSDYKNELDELIFMRNMRLRVSQSPDEDPNKNYFDENYIKSRSEIIKKNKANPQFYDIELDKKIDEYFDACGDEKLKSLAGQMRVIIKYYVEFNDVLKHDHKSPEYYELLKKHMNAEEYQNVKNLQKINSEIILDLKSNSRSYLSKSLPKEGFFEIIKLFLMKIFMPKSYDNYTINHIDNANKTIKIVEDSANLNDRINHNIKNQYNNNVIKKNVNLEEKNIISHQAKSYKNPNKNDDAKINSEVKNKLTLKN